MNGPKTRTLPTTRFVVSKNCSRLGVLSLIATTFATAAMRSARSGPMSTLVPCGQL
jgi:hypothetical protein